MYQSKGQKNSQLHSTWHTKSRVASTHPDRNSCSSLMGLRPIKNNPLETSLFCSVPLLSFTASSVIFCLGGVFVFILRMMLFQTISKHRHSIFGEWSHPNYKGSTPSTVANYRPISITPEGWNIHTG